MSYEEPAGRIPLIRIRDYLLVAVQGVLTDRMVLQLKEDVAHKLVLTECRGLIVDVSGIELMDSFIARAIRDISLIAQIMGVETVVCGIDPATALTLVEMGMEIHSVTTKFNLDEALRELDSRCASIAEETALVLDGLTLDAEAQLGEELSLFLEDPDADNPAEGPEGPGSVNGAGTV